MAADAGRKRAEIVWYAAYGSRFVAMESGVRDTEPGRVGTKKRCFLDVTKKIRGLSVSQLLHIGINTKKDV